MQRGDLLGVLPSATGEGGVEDGGTGDGSAGAPRFAPPSLVLALSDPSADDEDPTFTGDLRELYFSSTRSDPNSDIWVSRRATPVDPWGAPSLVPELSSPAIDRSPSVSLDGLQIWFSTTRANMFPQIWHASRASDADPWGTPAPVSELASVFFDGAPSVDAAETTMFFASYRGGAPTADIYSTTRPSAAWPWAPPARVPGLDTPLDENDPFVAQGGLVVFFALTHGMQTDLYWSSRRSTDATFPTPLPLVGVNSPFSDNDPALSPDLLYMMFSSNRTGNFEIYETHAVN